MTQWPAIFRGGKRRMKGVYSTYFRGENMSAKSSADEAEGTRERLLLLLPAPLLLLTPAALLYCSKQTCLGCDMPMCCCWLR